MENIALAIIKRIEEMTNNRTEELTENEIKISKAKSEASAADHELTEAIKNADIKVFEAAKEKKEHAELIIDMLTKRNQFIASQDFISEQESDNVIDSLAKYEEDLSAGFVNDITELVNQLNTLLINYRKNIQEAESAISTWLVKIHRNYRRMTSPYKERANEPQPVRVVAYTGNEESNEVQIFLNGKNIRKLIK